MYDWRPDLACGAAVSGPVDYQKGGGRLAFHRIHPTRSPVVQIWPGAQGECDTSALHNNSKT